jgi:NAD(P)H-dependent flavin oxidoreductase YrpB (nitropropane dioxygenase family)
MISGMVSFKGWTTGDLSEGIYPMGQIVGLIDDIPTVAELIKRTVEEAMETKKRLDQLI